MLLSYQDYHTNRRLDADVVVVGTGAGGAVAGTELAEAGYDVLFIEEGSYHGTGSFSPHVGASAASLYRDAGATTILGDPPIPFVEGRCVGGSTVINGGMAYRPPERVLDSWERTTGTADLGARALEPLFDHVETRISAAHQLAMSVGKDSQLMVQGAERLGWRYEINRRNQNHCVGANNCAFGCPTGAKQSTLLSYLPRAFLAGARCASELRVEKLMIEHGRCVGVSARAMDPTTRQPGPRLSVRSKAVVIACGAIQTPYLLLRHGLGRPSKQLGKNFLCHPNAKLIAIYPFDVYGWKGVSQYAQIREFLDEGILLAENFVPAGALAAHLSCDGADAWELMQRYNQMLVSGILVEDSTTGSVRRGLFGPPAVRYQISDFDVRRFCKGMELLATLHFEMGAESVLLPLTTDARARSLDAVKARLARGIRREELELFTVHLMGTACIGTDPKQSVLSPSGELWDLPGCYVADASTFPTAIGVNPQVTIMALATRLAWRLDLDRVAA